MKKRTSAVIALGLVLLTGYLFHTPIPEGLVDTLYFRMIVASTKAGFMFTAVSSVVLPDVDNLHVHLQRFLTELSMSAPDVEVPGSNLTARFEEFDGVRVLIYEPLHRGPDLIPGFVFCHGGGYAYGSTKLYGPVTRQLAEELQMVLISIEYRLAPEHPLPAGPIDGIKATKHFLRHAADYGVDANRVTIGGDSAGGHLTAVVVQDVHDDPTVPNIKLQVHFYPWMQCLDFNTPSYQLYENTFGELGLSKPRVAEFVAYNYAQRSDAEFERHLMANRHTSAEFMASPLFRARLGHDIIFQKLENSSFISSSEYVPSSLPDSADESWTLLPPFFAEAISGSSPFTDIVPSLPPFFSSSASSPVTPEMSYTPQEHFHRGNDTLWSEIRDYFLDVQMAPLFREDFSGLPKAFVATGDLDILRDDGIFYVHALEQAGVEVTWNNYEGAWHAIAAAGPIKDIPTGVRMINDAIEFVKENI